MGSDQSPECGPDSDPDAGRTDSGDNGDVARAAEADRPPAERTQTPDPGADRTVSIDTLFETLARPGNRYVLSYVIQENGPVPYHELVEYVVDKAETPMDLSTSEFRGRIATRLVHSNLPKLEDANLVEYDTESQVIRETEATEVAVPYLELAMEQSLTD